MTIADVRFLQLRQVGFERSPPRQRWVLPRLTHLHLDDWRALPGPPPGLVLTNALELPALTHLSSRQSVELYRLRIKWQAPARAPSFYWVGLGPVAAQLEFAAVDEFHPQTLQELQHLGPSLGRFRHLVVRAGDRIGTALVLDRFLRELPAALAVLDLAEYPFTAFVAVTTLARAADGEGLQVLRLPRLDGAQQADVADLLGQAAEAAEARGVTVEWV